MLTDKEIFELVNGGEGYNVDFKRSVPQKVRDLTEEACSFANAAGGYIRRSTTIFDTFSRENSGGNKKEPDNYVTRNCEGFRNESFIDCQSHQATPFNGKTYSYR
jgi:hypothetical protein